MTGNRRLRAPFATLLVALAILACREKPAEQALQTGRAGNEGTAPRRDAAAPDLTRVRINYNPTMAYVPFFLANDEGYFREEGIELELVRIESNAAMLAIADGQLDVLNSSMRPGIFNMIARGKPVQFVADRGHTEPGLCAAEGFGAPPPTAARIRKTKTLRGERIALGRGGNMEYLIDRLLARENLTHDDVQIVDLPQGDYVSSSRRHIDAVRYMLEPNLSNQIANGTMEIVMTMDEVAPHQQLYAVIFGKRLLRDDPELGRRFMRAYLRGARLNNEKSNRHVAIVSKYTNLPEEIVRRACWQKISVDGQIHIESVLDYLKWAKKKGLIDEIPETSAWWNPSFIDAAQRDLAAGAGGAKVR